MVPSSIGIFLLIGLALGIFVRRRLGIWLGVLLPVITAVSFYFSLTHPDLTVFLFSNALAGFSGMMCVGLLAGLLFRKDRKPNLKP